MIVGYLFAGMHLQCYIYLIHKLKCKLTEWRKKRSRINLIKKNITETEAFNFGVSDIARLREEIVILIEELHGIYTNERKQKTVEKFSSCLSDDKKYD